MTPLARALRKAYRQLAGNFAPEPAVAGAARGWVDPLRLPGETAPASSDTWSADAVVSLEQADADERIRRWVGFVPPVSDTPGTESQGASGLIRFDLPHDLRREADVVYPSGRPANPVPWPEICRRMHASKAGPALEGIARHLVDWQAETGGQRVLITGPGRRIGRTATLISLARAILENSSAAVLLVDATSQLSDRTASTADEGAIRDPAVEEPPAVVTLVPERLWLASLARLGASPMAAGESDDQPSLAGPLLVLIDGGAWETLDRSLWLRREAIDGIVEIRRFADSRVDADIEQRRVAADLPVVGVIETLAPAAHC